MHPGSIGGQGDMAEFDFGVFWEPFLCEPTTWMVPVVLKLHPGLVSAFSLKLFYWCSLGIDHQLIKGASGQVLLMPLLFLANLYRCPWSQYS